MKPHSFPWRKQIYFPLYHTKEVYADLAKSYADFGADSICIKDMSGLLKPYEAYDLVKAIKKAVDLPVEIHSHATTGLSRSAYKKGNAPGHAEPVHAEHRQPERGPQTATRQVR